MVTQNLPKALYLINLDGNELYLTPLKNTEALMKHWRMTRQFSIRQLLRKKSVYEQSKVVSLKVFGPSKINKQFNAVQYLFVVVCI